MEGAWSYCRPRAWTVHPRGPDPSWQRTALRGAAAVSPSRTSHGPPGGPFFSDSAGMCQGVWFLLILAEVDVAHGRLGPGSIAPAGLMGRGVCRASSNGGVN